MRKPTDGQLAVAALIAFAVWLFVALPLYYGPRDDSASQKCSSKEEKDYGFWEKTRCDPVTYLTAWLVGFTGVLAFSTIGLWWVTRQGAARQSSDMQAALEHARQSLTAIERAFVAFDKISIVTISSRSGIVDYRISLNVVNSGRTPARAYTSHVNLAVFDGPIPSNFRFPDREPHEQRAESVLTPQMITVLQIDLFIQDAVAAFERRKTPLIYGWIEYNDIFPDSRRHRTEFCMLVEVFADPREVPIVIQGPGIPIVSARPWGRYNRQDDDCLYRPGEVPIANEGELPPLTPPPPDVQITPVIPQPR
jgi:hypothetical protein